MLYDDLNGARKYGGLKALPKFLAANLNPNFELRPYQREAFENFITHFESNTRPRPTQVLFHMATGSGKTLIMAGLILYLYTRGYRNFLFFVNLSNILDKTRENFLNPASAKYLFAKEIVIDGERVRVNVTKNFRHADDKAINLCFSTTQGLHTGMTFVREGAMTFHDFDECKVALISDEAHHLNADTKKLSATEEEDRTTWENTIEHIFKRNAENILLEFTATCDLNNESINRKYADKIVFDYSLQKFYDDGYSKDILTLRSDKGSRIWFALILSQYRLKIFQEHRLNVKPVVLFKSKTIGESKNFMSQFIDDVKNLRGDKLRELSAQSDGIIRRAFDYFASKNISLDDLAAELREDFSEAHCISANDDKDATENQILLNSLEDLSNPYRAIFEVKKLDEGWDVLNLFDIVRLYETRQPYKATVAEAQLIGRGARYFPFKFDDEQEKYRRKFDGDAANDLRICETLYYHCQNDSAYIADLHRALHEIGLRQPDRRRYVLKESFKRDELYQRGVIFLNSREEIGRNEIFELMPAFKNEIYTYRATAEVGQDKIMREKVESVDDKVQLHTEQTTIKQIAEINYAIIHKALRKNPIYKFDELKKIFPNLTSTRQFITDENYLGGVRIDITCVKPIVEIFYLAAVDVLNKIAAEISEIKPAYRGTTEFFARNIHKVFRDKIVTCNEPQTPIDLSAEDWFAYVNICGTSLEKDFVEYFGRCVEELREIYEKIYLVRNERECCIYSFAEGRRFEPDFVLFLQKKIGGGFEQLQIFIEPKGEHLTEHDAWKEDFLREIEKSAIPVKVYADDKRYKIFGLPFYNDAAKKKFDSEFKLKVLSTDRA